ncbi:DNA-binding protein, partial [Trichormus variabilis V5]|nr:DNA-binding protein [Trichormus variabilis V5]
VYQNTHIVERIIWIDEGYIIAFVIDINAKKGLPEPRKISDILEAITEGIAFKQQQDPWARIIRDENLTDKEKEYRDKAWEIISSLIIEEPSIYY